MNSRKPSHDSLRLFRLFRTGSAPGDSVCFPMRWSRLAGGFSFYPGASFAPLMLTLRYGGRGLRLTRADPPLRSGQPSPLWRVRLPPPGLPTRRGPHWAALAAAARPPLPTPDPAVGGVFHAFIYFAVEAE